MKGAWMLFPKKKPVVRPVRVSWPTSRTLYRRLMARSILVVLACAIIALATMWFLRETLQGYQ